MAPIWSDLAPSSVTLIAARSPTALIRPILSYRAARCRRARRVACGCAVCCALGRTSPRARLRVGRGRDQLVAAGAFAQVQSRIVARGAPAGPHRDLLEFCSNPKAQNPDGTLRYFPWITPKRLHNLNHQAARRLAQSKSEGQPGRLGTCRRTARHRAARRRFAGRHTATHGQIGCLHPNQAAATPKRARANEHYNWKVPLDSGKTIDQEFVGVTHSLGAYLFFNALNPDAGAASAPEPSQPQATTTDDKDAALRYILE